MADIVSNFQFTQHTITRLVLNRRPEGEQEAEEGGYFANYSAGYADGMWKGAVALGFKKRMLSEETMYELIIVGDFQCPGDHTERDEDLFVKHLKLNGSSTLIPIARAALVAASSLMNIGEQYKIPNINVYQLQWQNEQ